MPSPVPLSLLCVTRGDVRVKPLIDRFRAAAQFLGAECQILIDGSDVQSGGYLESVLSAALATCRGTYILRLDDDEALAPDTLTWLKSGVYHDHLVWSFPRAAIWQDDSHALISPPLWPDFQTRLTHRSLAHRPDRIHAAAPAGYGQIAPGAIYHYKFRLYSLDERHTQAVAYDRLQPGAGSGKFLAFQAPEHAMPPEHYVIVPLTALPAPVPVDMDQFLGRDASISA